VRESELISRNATTTTYPRFTDREEIQVQHERREADFVSLVYIYTSPSMGLPFITIITNTPTAATTQT
jgi:hypothetical protein